MKNFKVKIKKCGITDEDVLEDIQAVAKRLNRDSLKAEEYAIHGTYGVTTVRRKFGLWNDALNKTGLKVINKQNIPEVDLMENFANAWQKLGRQPNGSDFKNIDDLSEISLATYEHRFGSWNKFLLKFQEYIEVGEIYSSDPILQTNSKNQSRRSNRKINWRLRAKILIRDNCICRMCGASPAKNPDVVLHVDHIKAWANGGETVEENLQTLCSVCNVGKSDEDF